MNKKIAFGIILSGLVVAFLIVAIVALFGKTAKTIIPGSDNSNKTNYTNMYIKEMKKYKSIKIKEIDKICITESREDGPHTAEITDKDEIKRIFKELGDIQIGEKTEVSVTDAGTSYKIFVDEEEKCVFNFELNILCTEDARYQTSGSVNLENVDFK